MSPNLPKKLSNEQIAEDLTDWAWAAIGSSKDRLTKREFYEQFPNIIYKKLERGQ